MENSTYIFNEEKVLLTQLGDEGVAFDIESNEYYTLNETLFKIANGIKNQQSIPEIVDFLLNEYAISDAFCQEEIAKGIQQLMDKKIIFVQAHA
ncbi:PqqD family protein [Aquirufa beregesia]